MKIVLIQDVPKVGKKNDVVEVKDGHARNLIRQNLAQEATKQNIHLVKQKTGSDHARKERELEEARENGAKLKGSTVTLEMKAGEGGRLYGALTAIDIAAALEKEGYKVDKRNITIHHPIKSLGTSSATVKLHTEVSVDIQVQVVEKA